METKLQSANRSIKVREKETLQKTNHAMLKLNLNFIDLFRGMLWG